MQVLNFRKCDYFSLKEPLVFLTYFVDCVTKPLQLLFLQDLHPLHQKQCCSSNNQRGAGVNPDQKRFTEELPAQQSREYSSGEQAGLEDTLMQRQLLVLCYSLNTFTSATSPVWTDPEIFWWEKECFFLIYLCSFTGYQLAAKPALVLENPNKASKSSSQNA